MIIQGVIAGVKFSFREPVIKRFIAVIQNPVPLLYSLNFLCLLPSENLRLANELFIKLRISA